MASNNSNSGGSTDGDAVTDIKPPAKTEPIDPNSTRERLRSWLGWLPVWFLMPIGLGPTDGGAISGGDFHIGYGGPHDGPGHMGGGGYGDMGGGDMGGSGF